MSRQRPSDPDAWTVHGDPLTRLRVGLADVYRYCRAGEQMLTLLHRDMEAVPPRVAQVPSRDGTAMVGTLLRPFPMRQRKPLGAAVAHAVAFSTLRSLCVTQGLSDRSAVELMVGMVSGFIASPLRK
jgi:hypothetical protein